MIGDDVLGEAGTARSGKRDLPHALKHVYHSERDGEQRADHADRAADAHEHRTEEDADSQHRAQHAGRGRRVEFLNLGFKPVSSEDGGEVFRRYALFLAARRGDSRVLQEVAEIFPGSSHRVVLSLFAVR